MAQGVLAGQRLSQQLAARPLFNPLLVDMVEVGEHSGSLPEMLDRAADYFDEEADGMRDFLTTAMEPMLMLLVGTIVSLFVVALMMPLMSLAAH
jgi:type II secretory pathway component PulF